MKGKYYLEELLSWIPISSKLILVHHSKLKIRRHLIYVYTNLNWARMVVRVTSLRRDPCEVSNRELLCPIFQKNDF